MAIYDDPTAALRNLDRHHAGTAGSRVFDSPQRALQWLGQAQPDGTDGGGDDGGGDDDDEGTPRCTPRRNYACPRDDCPNGQGRECVQHEDCSITCSACHKMYCQLDDEEVGLSVPSIVSG